MSGGRFTLEDRRALYQAARARGKSPREAAKGLGAAVAEIANEDALRTLVRSVNAAARNKPHVVVRLTIGLDVRASLLVNRANFCERNDRTGDYAGVEFFVGPTRVAYVRIADGWGVVA